MDKQKFAFTKTNYILLITAVALIVLGFILMTGPSSTETHFEPDIFSFRRIKMAPAICFTGFIFVIVAVMYKSKSKNEDKTTNKE